MIGDEPVGADELIDTSTPEALERDFYAWLNGRLSSNASSASGSASNSPAPAMEWPQSSGATAPAITATAAESPLTETPLPHIEELAKFRDLTTNDAASPAGSVESGGAHSPPSSAPSTSSSLGGGMGPPPYHCGFAPNPFIWVQPPPAEPAIVLAPVPAGKRGAGSRGSVSGTNQLGRTYNPGLPLSMREREQIVELYSTGWKICDISKHLCVTHSCVSKILHRYRSTGSVKPKDAKEGRMESPLVGAIRDYRFRLGIIRQSEIREQLIRDGHCSRDNAPSRSSINHILRTKLHLTVRSKRSRHSRDHTKSAEWPKAGPSHS